MKKTLFFPALILAAVIAANAETTSVAIKTDSAAAASAPKDSSTTKTGASLDIKVTPDSATITLDKKEIGHGHATVTGLAAGQYTIRVFAKGYDSQNTRVTLTANQQKSVSITLEYVKEKHSSGTAKHSGSGPWMNKQKKGKK